MQTSTTSNKTTATNFEDFKSILNQLEIPSKENKTYSSFTIELMNEIMEKNIPFLSSVPLDFNATISLRNLKKKVEDELSDCTGVQDLVEKINIHIINLPILPKEVLDLIFSPLSIFKGNSRTLALLSKSWNNFCYSEICFSERRKALLNLISDHTSQIEKKPLSPELKRSCIKEMTYPSNLLGPHLIKLISKPQEIDLINKEIKAIIFKNYSDLESQIALTGLEKIFIIHSNDPNTSFTRATILLSKEPNEKLRFIPKNADDILKKLKFSSNPSYIKLRELLEKKTNDPRPSM